MLVAPRPWKTRKGNERGATVVEFAVIASLVLIIVFGILEFAIVFMQDHLVEQGAREGVRVGVRANNYTNFNGVPATGVEECNLARCNRKQATEQAVREYLDVFYADPDVQVAKVRENLADPPILSVTVTVDNFMPGLISALVPGYSTPETFTFKATGFYEDPDEYAAETP